MNLASYPLFRTDRKILSRLCLVGLLITLLTIAVDSAIIIRMDANSPTGGDGPYFIDIAKSLAANRGFYLQKSFWPDHPELGRLPLWPAILSIPEWFFPSANDNATLRFTGAVLHGLAAAFLVFLTFQVTGSLAGAALAGFILGFYPPASGLVVGGYSEVAYLMVTIAGLILVFEGGRWAYAGTLICGIGVLARSNYLLMPFMVVVLLVLLRPRALLHWRNLRLLAIGTALYCLFPALWIVRNYIVSGHFPVVSALEGQTLYGGNNPRVATDLSVWGYWIMPNEIPGEKTKQELAQTRTELEVSEYYHNKAMEFIRNNWFALPRLLLGKLIRSFVPVPWVPLAASYLTFFFRACVYAAFAASLWIWRAKNVAYSILVGAMFLVTLATTLIYYGSFRFAFCVEPFLFPFIGGAAVSTARMLGRKRSEVAVAR